ncbi:restriction endonuclease subunit S [Sulfitobacter noctilucicola]|uniref:Type I restriction enzyme S subunit n=1 Tax=Sulfitobacter noctilucicola TaxID=1342301 RepID=A0A7W6Q4M7_9RHOB|nr:restriction endonuclease subunit S [Sulfitobacter noctilucicola]MBB4172885.1 type I restriction enzyme S subunit [Sulfitobacter noctilucicola]
MTSRRHKGEAGLPTLSVTLNNGLVRRDSLERKTDTNLDPIQHLRVLPGDIAYNMMRMWQGASGLAHEEALVSPAYVVLAPQSNLDPRYAAYLFKTDRMIHNFWAYSYGLTNDRLRLYPNDALKVPVDIPPLPEQQKIADILSTWDAAIEKTEALLATARTQKRALMQQLLTGKRRFPEFEDQPWEEVRLGQIAEIISGPAFKSNEFTDDGHKLVRGSNVKRGYLDWSPSITVHWPSDIGLEDYRLVAGDIVIAMDGYVGRSHAYLAKEPEEPLLLVQRVARVRSKDSDPSFLYANICSHDFFAHCERMKTATGIAHITMKDIRDFKVPGITRAEQNAIGQVFEGCDGEVGDLVAQVQKLRTEKKALMQQLLTGKRRVVV